MEEDNLVLGVRKVSVVRDRVDLSHGDPSKSGGATVTAIRAETG